MGVFRNLLGTTETTFQIAKKALFNPSGNTVLRTYTLPDVTGGVVVDTASNTFTQINPLITPAESWVGPSSTSGVYFKGGFVGMGIPTPGTPLDVIGGSGDGTQAEAFGIRIRATTAVGNTQILQLGTKYIAGGVGYGYIQSVYWGGVEQPLKINPQGGTVQISGAASLANLSVNNTFAIQAPSSTVGGVPQATVRFGPPTGYTISPTSISNIFDKSLWYEGAGLAFYTIAGADISGSVGIERMRISSDGKVGIGTTNPLNKLHASGVIGTGLLFDNTDSAGTANFFLTAGIVGYSHNSLALGETYSAVDYFHLTTFQKSLFLGGKTNLTTTASVTILNSQSKAQFLNIAATAPVIVLANGDMGIGASPTVPLDVVGAIRTTTTIATGGYTVATLPAGTVGQRAYVTDATAPTYNAVLTGGGAINCPVFRNATVWVSA